MSSENAERWVLTMRCPDVAGIQAQVTAALYEAGAFLEDVASYGDPQTQTYFSRVAFHAVTPQFSIDRLRSRLESLGHNLSMAWEVAPAARRCPTIIMVSKPAHCLRGLLHAWQDGLLPIDVKAVISNHDKMRPFVEWHGLPFHHLPVRPDTKRAQEAEVLGIVEALRAELVVLARYMQVLSNTTAGVLFGRCINIHHSFLPGFKGARPYHQAHARGVKIIGATAHYVTADLDEGPIIEQAVERVDHAQSAEQLAQIGSVIETTVLTRAVRWHAERRVLLNGARTVVFK